jgi:hypothetical protein
MSGSPAPSPATDCFAPIPDHPDTFTPVSCDDPTAEARELERVTATLLLDGKYLPKCSDSYNFALDVDAVPAVRVTSSKNPRFACVRRLNPPHATDPGQGREPIDVGDCVYTVEGITSGPITLQSFIEMPCSEAAAHTPGYRVFALGSAVNCPTDRTDVTFSIGSFGVDDSRKPSVTGCAEKL